MATNNFEKDILNKLEERTLEPSKTSWNRLEAQLDSKAKTQFRSKLLRLAVAASIIGVAFSAYFFRNEDVNTIAPSVSDTTIEVKETIKEIETETRGLEKKETNNRVVNLSEKTLKSKKTKSNRFKNKQAVTKVAQTENDRVTVHSNENIIELSKPEIVIKEAVVATEQVIEKESNSQIDDEVNRLLEQAENELIADYNSPKITVSETDLLQEVETELEESFRDRAFKKIKSSYNSIRTAYIERNE